MPVAPVDDEFEAAQEEWDAVATITIGNTSQQAAHGMGDAENAQISTKPISTPQLSFSQAITHFESHSDLELHKVSAASWLAGLFYDTHLYDLIRPTPVITKKHFDFVSSKIFNNQRLMMTKIRILMQSNLSSLS